MTHQLNMHGMDRPDAQATPEQRQAVQRGASVPNAGMLGLTSAAGVPGALGSAAFSETANNLADPTRTFSAPDPR